MHPVLFQIGSLIIPSYGAVAAIGALLALALAQVTAHRSGLDPRHAWNMLVLAIFAGIATSRLLLIVLNLSDLRRHPSWLLAVALVHHPLLSGVGIVGASVAVYIYIRWVGASIRVALDSLAAPIALGCAAEQVGALLAGSDYGRESASATLLKAVIYNSPLAARWSGTPLGVALYPVQGYAAVGALVLAAICLGWLYLPRRTGDVASVWLIGSGTLFFLTEMYRDWEGRGVMLNGLIDAPQLVGLALVLVGGLMLIQWPARNRARAVEEASR